MIVLKSEFKINLKVWKLEDYLNDYIINGYLHSKTH